jgi:hypothetical protein
MSAFFHGMISMGFLTASLFFTRFWRRIGDGLFAAFAIAFLLLALNQAMIGLSGRAGADESWPFLPSLGAFGLLILAILVKNLSRRGQ